MAFEDSEAWEPNPVLRHLPSSEARTAALVAELRRADYRRGLKVGAVLGFIAAMILVIVASCANTTAPKPASSCWFADTLNFIDATTHQPETLVIWGHLRDCR